MDRVQWAGIAVTIGALALFGARLVLDDPEPGERYAALEATADDGTSVGRGPGDGGWFSGRGAVGGDRTASRGSGAREPRIRKVPSGPAGAGSRSGRGTGGSAAVVGTGGGGARGYVGSPVGGTPGARHGGVHLAGSAGQSRRRTGPDAPKAPGRSDLVELLAAQPLPQTSVDPAGEEGEDVVLAVEKPEDIEQAQRVEDVEHDGVAIDLEEDSVFAFPNAGNARGDAGAITFEVEPRWAGGDETNNAFVRIQDGARFENRLELVKNGRYLRFIFTPANGREADISVPIDAWEPGEPHTITASWGPIDPENPERGGQTTLYIDGRPVGSNRYEGELLIAPSTPMYVGSATGNYKGANARISGFRVYGRTLAPDEVR